MRERKRQDRLVKPMSNLNTLDDVKPRLVATGLQFEGNRIVGVTTVKPIEAQSTIPLYDPSIHKPGDRVLVKPQYGRSKKLIEVTIPEIDADGNPLPEL